MADRRRSGGTRASGQPSRAAASWPVDGAVSAAGSGSATSTPPTRPRAAPEPDFPWRDTATLATYRHLLSKGLRPEQAANLTAFLCGIPVSDIQWKLSEVNRLLFLRRLAQIGSWGPLDGRPAKAH